MAVNGPIRIVQHDRHPATYVAIDALGYWLASGRECALKPMAEAFNATIGPAKEATALSRVVNCIECGYPCESGEVKCLECLSPAPVQESSSFQEQKEKSQQHASEEWF